MVEQTHATAGPPLSSTLSAGVAKGYTITSYPLNAVSQKHREYLTGMPWHLSNLTQYQISCWLKRANLGTSFTKRDIILTNGCTLTSFEYTKYNITQNIVLIKRACLDIFFTKTIWNHFALTKRTRLDICFLVNTRENDTNALCSCLYWSRTFWNVSSGQSDNMLS